MNFLLSEVSNEIQAFSCNAMAIIRNCQAYFFLFLFAYAKMHDTQWYPDEDQ